MGQGIADALTGAFSFLGLLVGLGGAGTTFGGIVVILNGTVLSIIGGSLLTIVGVAMVIGGGFVFLAGRSAG